MVLADFVGLVGPLPADMPKIKSGASGRRRARQEQRRDLKSAGGGDSLEGAGVGLGRVFRQDRGLGWGH